MKSKVVITLAMVAIVFVIFSCGTEPTQEKSIVNNSEILEEIENSLNQDIFNAWYPISVDTVHGGFLSDFSSDWQDIGPHHKMLVSQSRHIWATSMYNRVFNTNKYEVFSKHGFEFLTKHMWDSVFGGFYMLTDRSGQAVDSMYTSEKRAYGTAFAIYALASYYLQSGNEDALMWAKKAFYWLDQHSRDSVHQGYFDMMTREGKWMYTTDFVSETDNMPRVAWKDYNSTIHILEALSELYKVWPDSVLKLRLEELLYVVRDKFVSDKGSLVLHFTREWEPVSFKDSSKEVRHANHYFDHLSYGHDVETAYLLLEASHVLGVENDSITMNVAKKMVDNSIDNAWDSQNGGLFYAGYFIGDSDSIELVDSSKSWWVQSEALNTFLLMAELYPQESRYRTLFEQQWDYIKKYQIDSVYKGWYQDGLDQNPENKEMPKASIWKVNYHNGRALMNCIQMLKGESELVIHFKDELIN